MQIFLPPPPQSQNRSYDLVEQTLILFKTKSEKNLFCERAILTLGNSFGITRI